MRAIIIAAGRGSRLEHHTDTTPKCMVEINGRSILSFQLGAFEQNGVDDLHIIRGYLSDKLVVPGATYYENEVWEQNNILHSLFCAEDAFTGPLLTTYSDIVYTPEVVEKLLATDLDIALVVDADWAKTYVGRDDHPVEQALLRMLELRRQLRQRGVLNVGSTSVGAIRIDPEDLRRFGHHVAPIPEEHAEQATDQPHDATRWPNSASVM